MDAFEAFGRAIRTIATDKKIWKVPVVLSAVASALNYVAGREDVFSVDPSLVPFGVAVALVIIALALQVPTFYYPTKAYQLRFYGRAINENELLRESFVGGLKAIVVALVYGFLVGLMALVMLIPAIAIYFVLPKSIGIYVAVVLAILPSLFALGLVSMMVPAYIWTDNFDTGMDLIGDAWREKKETVLFGLIVLLFIFGAGLISSTLGEVISWIPGGIVPAILAGLIDGAVSELGNVVTNVAGAEMFLRLTGRPLWDEKREQEGQIA